MIRIPKEKFIAALIVLTLIISTTTYINQDNKSLLYILTIASILATSIALKINFNGKFKFIPISYLIFALTSVAGNSGSLTEFPLQSIVYPFIFFLVFTSIWKLFTKEFQNIEIIKYYFILIAAIASLPIIGIKNIPIIGELNTGRYIFFTTIPSSASIYWNVNYYAASQAAGFWLTLSILSKSEITKYNKIILFIIGISIILGSSRGITSSFLFSLILYQVLGLSKNLRIALFIFLLLIFIAFGNYIFDYQLSEETEVALRLDRGLNSRDQLWNVAIDLIKLSPFIGYGSPELAGKLMLAHGATTTTPQNSYLTFISLFGIFNASIFYIAFLYIILKMTFTRNLDRITKSIFCLFVFLVIDGFVRSYIIGGVGLLPLLLSTSFVYLLKKTQNEF